MSSGKRRNPLNLSLPPTVNEEGVAADEAGGIGAEDGGVQEGGGSKMDGSGGGQKGAAATLDSQLRQLSLSGTQMQRMNEWISQKKQV